MTTAEPLGYLGSLIRRAQQRHVAVWLSEVSADITSVQFAALAALTQSPGLSQRELCDALDLDRSTIADLVARLVRNGLVERVPDATDRRRYVLTVSERGESTFRELEPRVRAAQDVLAATLTSAERAELRGLLVKLLRQPG